MKRALLVIDVQNEYFDGLLPVSWPERSMDHVLDVMDAASEWKIPIAVIQHGAKDNASPVFRKGSHNWELHPEVLKRRRDVLIEKSWPDCFSETCLKEWLDERKIDTVTICGYMTQMCCDTTARRAYHLGYGVEFLSDATGTLGFSNDAGTVTGEELHRAILVTQTRFSKVMTAGQWISGLKINPEAE